MTTQKTIQPKVNNIFVPEINFLTTHGLTIDQTRIAKLAPKEQEEAIKDTFKAFLNDKLTTITDTIGAHRKKGIDFFIEDLKLMQCKAKLKLAMANYALDDIKTFINKIIALENIVNQKTQSQSSTPQNENVQSDSPTTQKEETTG